MLQHKHTGCISALPRIGCWRNLLIWDPNYITSLQLATKCVLRPRCDNIDGDRLAAFRKNKQIKGQKKEGEEGERGMGSWQTCSRGLRGTDAL